MPTSKHYIRHAAGRDEGLDLVMSQAVTRSIIVRIDLGGYLFDHRSWVTEHARRRVRHA